MNFGVASSVAAAQQFDWKVTVDFALEHGCNILQLYIPEILSETWPETKNFQNVLIHLPGNIAEYPSPVQLQKVSQHFTPRSWIVHQQPGMVISDFLEKNRLPDGFAGQLAIENDDHGGDPGSFLKCLKSAQKEITKINVVLDVHRFYVNFSSAHPVNMIQSNIYKILAFCFRHELPVILHIVDSKSYTSSHADWCALFDGLIPYKEIFRFLQQHTTNEKIIIFEYEDPQLTAQSIQRLKTFLNIENAKL